MESVGGRDGGVVVVVGVGGGSGGGVGGGGGSDSGSDGTAVLIAVVLFVTSNSNSSIACTTTSRATLDQAITVISAEREYPLPAREADQGCNAEGWPRVDLARPSGHPPLKIARAEQLAKESTASSHGC